jgi:hypothetical protein
MYVCVCVYMNVSVHMWVVYTHVYACISCIDARVRKRGHLPTHTDMKTCIKHAQKHTQTHAGTETYIFKYADHVEDDACIQARKRADVYQKDTQE